MNFRQQTDIPVSYKNQDTERRSQQLTVTAQLQVEHNRRRDSKHSRGRNSERNSEHNRECNSDDNGEHNSERNREHKNKEYNSE